MRVGLGFDVHAFEPGRPLVLGAVTLPGDLGLAGHSDGDVLSHAIADALLGAARLGDLGTHFPATDRWRDASGAEILAETARLLGDARRAVVDVDATVVAQDIRISSHRVEMIASIARSLGIGQDLVSIKATTTDRLGSIGRGEGIAVFAVAAVDDL
ncbi:MAG: 2-C-methyl-D-erythritol 2,4-cyclodiphosphate synthase [Actinomycetota bacterium]